MSRQSMRKYSLEQCQRTRACFGTDDGKWVYDDLRKEFCDRTSFDPTNTHATAFWEGQRHVLLAIQARMTFNTKALIKAIEEEEGNE